MLLSREVAIDSAEHARASEAAHAHLLAALDHYRAALAAPAAGSGPQLRTVFRVAKIWLDNAGSAEVFRGSPPSWREEGGAGWP